MLSFIGPCYSFCTSQILISTIDYFNCLKPVLLVVYSSHGAEGALPDLTDMFPRPDPMHHTNQQPQYALHPGPLESAALWWRRTDEGHDKRYDAKGAQL